MDFFKRHFLTGPLWFFDEKSQMNSINLTFKEVKSMFMKTKGKAGTWKLINTTTKDFSRLQKHQQIKKGRS